MTSLQREWKQAYTRGEKSVPSPPISWKNTTFRVRYRDADTEDLTPRELQEVVIGPLGDPKLGVKALVTRLLADRPGAPAPQDEVRQLEPEVRPDAALEPGTRIQLYNSLPPLYDGAPAGFDPPFHDWETYGHTVLAKQTEANVWSIATRKPTEDGGAQEIVQNVTLLPQDQNVRWRVIHATP